jgi:ribonuclease HII
MRRIGIDEAGYGPTLGPLAVVGVAVDAADGAALDAALDAALRGLGVRDSKRLHRPGDLAPLERVALPAIAWLTGTWPKTHAALRALVDDRDDPALPWLADDLALPVATASAAPWTLPDVVPHALAAHVVHPAAFNRALATGNKAALELRLVMGLLDRLAGAGAARATVDRLGGRRFYGEALAACGAVTVVDEAPVVSTYRVARPSGMLAVGFQVGSDDADALVGLASCIGKYLRELHMLRLNRWASARQAGLRSTAGYPEDARRWLTEAAPLLAGLDRAAVVRQA